MPHTPAIPLNERHALRIAEAAAALSVSTGTMQAWIRGGEIPLTRLAAPGGKDMDRVLTADLLAFAIKHRDNELPLPPALTQRRGGR